MPDHRRPRLLFLSHRVPFPPHNGAAIRSYNILRLLSRDFDITGLCFDRPDNALKGMTIAERLDGIAGYGRFEVVAIPQSSSRIRFGWDHCRSVVMRRPYTWYIHDVPEVRKRLRALLKKDAYDAVHVDSLDLVALLPELEGLPVALTHHNVESSLLQRRARRESNRIVSAYLSHQASLLDRAERYWIPRVALNIAVSKGDAESFARVAPTANIAVVPNGVDTEYFSPMAEQTDGCVFVGGTSWYPNLDALEWFVAEVLPHLRSLGMQGQVVWVGRATPAQLERYNHVPGLRLTGYVPDIRPFVRAASCFIAPLRVGGGTRLKLLDAWAMGKAVVSTSLGAEGLEIAEGENILIADTARDFAKHVMLVLEDSLVRSRLEEGARGIAEREYSWDVLGKRMRSLYMSLSNS